MIKNKMVENYKHKETNYKSIINYNNLRAHQMETLIEKSMKIHKLTMLKTKIKHQLKMKMLQLWWQHKMMLVMLFHHHKEKWLIIVTKKQVKIKRTLVNRTPLKWLIECHIHIWTLKENHQNKRDKWQVKKEINMNYKKITISEMIY